MKKKISGLLLLLVLPILYLYWSVFFYRDVELNHQWIKDSDTVSATWTDHQTLNIQGGDWPDAWFSLGYMQASRHLPQMLAERMIALGHYSEYGGQKYTTLDSFYITLNLEKLAASYIQHSDDTTLAALSSYSAGINAYMKNHLSPGRYILSGTLQEKWTPLHAMVLYCFDNWRNDDSWEKTLLKNEIERYFGKGPMLAFADGDTVLQILEGANTLRQLEKWLKIEEQTAHLIGYIPEKRMVYIRNIWDQDTIYVCEPLVPVEKNMTDRCVFKIGSTMDTLYIRAGSPFAVHMADYGVAYSRMYQLEAVSLSPDGEYYFLDNNWIALDKEDQLLNPRFKSLRRVTHYAIGISPLFPGSDRYSASLLVNWVLPQNLVSPDAESIVDRNFGYTDTLVNFLKHENGVARQVLNYLKPLLREQDEKNDIIRRMMVWNYTESLDSPEATFFHQFFSELIHEIFQDELDQLSPDLLKIIVDKPMWAADIILRLLEDPYGFWWNNTTTTEQENRDIILYQSLQKSVEQCTAQYGKDLHEWQWRDVHRLSRKTGYFSRSAVAIAGSHFSVPVSGFSYRRNNFSIRFINFSALEANN